MAVFINGMGNISPQISWGDHDGLRSAVAYTGSRMKSIEPDYSTWIDPKVSRRMSRIIKMGVTAALMALRGAGVEKPGAIITGTGYGCLEDTGTFMSKMVESEAQALNPTPFIQSTHNTVGSQIALLLQCEEYNQTYTQGALSFENALQDAFLFLTENNDKTVLLGGIDEITDASHAIQQRFGMFRKDLADTRTLFDSYAKGTIDGEGSAFFVLSAVRARQTQASVERIGTFHKPSGEKLKKGIHDFLLQEDLQVTDIDMLMSGISGDRGSDQTGLLIEEMFASSSLARFKHLCGEYPVAASFALWLAAKILHEQRTPDFVIFRETGRHVKNILIYNQYFGTHHSLILLKA